MTDRSPPDAGTRTAALHPKRSRERFARPVRETAAHREPLICTLPRG
ncbi:hypothetical protein ACFVVU_26590 [Kitasatospora sp. NPDC057965]